MQKICLMLTDLCKVLHKCMCEKSRTNKTIVDVVFLCLRQLICCISYLEKILKIERRDGITLSVSFRIRIMYHRTPIFLNLFESCSCAANILPNEWFGAVVAYRPSYTTNQTKWMPLKAILLYLWTPHWNWSSHWHSTQSRIIRCDRHRMILPKRAEPFGRRSSNWFGMRWHSFVLYLNAINSRWQCYAIE